MKGSILSNVWNRIKDKLDDKLGIISPSRLLGDRINYLKSLSPGSKLIAEEMITKLDRGIKEYLEMKIEEERQREELAQLIRDNPGCGLSMDNGGWIIHAPLPSGFDDWEDEKQEDWLFEKGQICDDSEFPGLEMEQGLIKVFCLMLNIEILD